MRNPAIVPEREACQSAVRTPAREREPIPGKWSGQDIGEQAAAVALTAEDLIGAAVTSAARLPVTVRGGLAAFDLLNAPAGWPDERLCRVRSGGGGYS